MCASKQYVDSAGRPLICPRIQYTFPPFDVSIQREGFTGVGQIVYGREEQIVVDDDGRQWFPQNLMAPILTEYLTEHPSRFIAVATKRSRDFAAIRRSVELASTRLDAVRPTEIADTLCLLLDAYKDGMKYGVVGSLIVETFYEQFEALVSRAIPSRRDRSVYIASLLAVPVAKEAARVGFVQDKRGTKRISDVEGSPVCIFANTIPWSSSVHDDIVCKAFWKSDDLARFWSLRFIVPLVVQFAEEWRYADYSLRSHLFYFIRAGCRLLQRDLDDVFQHSYIEFLEALRNDG